MTNICLLYGETFKKQELPDFLDSRTTSLERYDYANYTGILFNGLSVYVNLRLLYRLATEKAKIRPKLIVILTRHEFDTWDDNTISREQVVVYKNFLRARLIHVDRTLLEDYVKRQRAMRYEHFRIV